MKTAFCSITDTVTPSSGAEPLFPEQNPRDLKLPLLALDIGMKRIGVAVCDRLGMSCRGIACLHRNDQGWWKQLLKVIHEYGAKGVVVGLPLNMDGSEGVQAEDARAAASQLVEVINLPVCFQDERLSSWSAKERLYAQGLSEKRVRERVDQTAAAIILEDFLSANPEVAS